MITLNVHATNYPYVLLSLLLLDIMTNIIVHAVNTSTTCKKCHMFLICCCCITNLYTLQGLTLQVHSLCICFLFQNCFVGSVMLPGVCCSLDLPMLCVSSNEVCHLWCDMITLGIYGCCFSSHLQFIAKSLFEFNLNQIS